MASRRTRIKGIANIPQRKKGPLTAENNDQDEKGTNDQISITSLDSDSLNVSSQESNITKDQPLIQLENQNSVEQACSKTDNNLNIKDSTLPNTGPDVVPDAASSTLVEKSTDQINTSKPQIVRRKALRPGINLNLAKKRTGNKELTENIGNLEGKADILSENISIETAPDNNISLEKDISVLPVNNDTENITKSIINLDKSCSVTNKNEPSSFQKEDVPSEVTLNEIILNDVPVPSRDVFSSPTIRKLIPETNNLNVSENEYPPPPPSPSKLNRHRIKAIPRFGQRKISCSASESEDESRKYGRIRNNSVCSVASLAPEIPYHLSESQPPKDTLPFLQKKLNKTEQSRKLAEARREFQKKFGTKSPDKQKLKMIDLIFYNPVSNPMCQKTEKDVQTIENKKTTEDEQTSIEPEENVDEVEEEPQDSMPVPQITIDPSGEIILDEQSLIVENSEVSKQREKIQNSQVVDGDVDTGYGIYKRARRSKDWTQKETVGFYKALNLIGTDFTLMVQLFPRRTRRELKIKFKKEEKINRYLIDKAIMQPCMYNFVDLKRELELEAEELTVLQKIREEELEKIRKDRKEKRAHKRKAKPFPTDQIQKLPKLNEQPVDKTQPPVDTPTGETPQNKETSNPNLNSIRSPPITISSVLESPQTKTKKNMLPFNNLEDIDADESDLENSESEEEETIKPILHPTRSGRMPKSTLRYTHHAEVREASALKKRRSSVSSIESNPEKLVPGSVVVINEEGPDGKSEYKVYMVTPEKKLTLLDLEPEIVSTIVAQRQNVRKPLVPERKVNPPVSENNVTFAEDV